MTQHPKSFPHWQRTASMDWQTGGDFRFQPGMLLDSDPVVALHSKDDAKDERAERLFSESAPPFGVTELCSETLVL